MDTLDTSFASFKSTGLPDELSPAVRDLFEQGLAEWENECAERATDEIEPPVDDFEYWHARANAEQAAFNKQINEYIEESRRNLARLNNLIREAV